MSLLEICAYITIIISIVLIVWGDTTISEKNGGVQMKSGKCYLCEGKGRVNGTTCLRCKGTGSNGVFEGGKK